METIFLCSECKTTDEHKFARYRPDLCRECKKTQKPYNCKHCGDSSKENFSEGRYNICKKCRSIENCKNNKDKRRQEKFQNLELKAQVEDELKGSGAFGLTSGASTIENSLPTLKAIELGVEKFLATNRKFMSGYTIQEILENFSAFNIHKSKEDDIRNDEIEHLKDELSEIKFLLSEMI